MEQQGPRTAVEAPPEHTVGDVLRIAAARRPDRTALVDGALVDGAPGADRAWTTAEVLADAERVARALLRRFAPGEKVAIWAPNSPEWVLVEFGAALAGLTLVTVNPAYLAAEVEFVLGQSRASGVVVAPEFRGRDLVAVVEEVRPRLDALREVVPLGDWDAFLGSGEPDAALPAVAPTDIAQVQYTSGTTGSPKGTLLTHRGLALNGRVFAEALGAGESDVWINPMPLFHTAGCGLTTLGALQTGGAHVVPPAFEPGLVLDLFEAHRGSVILCVPTMLVRLLDDPSLAARDLASWRLVALGGAPVAPDLVARAEKALGVAVTIGYGQTEASPYITHTLPDDPNPQWAHTVGRPLPHVEVRITDAASGAPLPPGGVGEIRTRGICVMAGYFDAPEATRAALEDGWLRTGDLGSLDADGYLRIQGRLKDMIIRGGENVYPREVEDVLHSHPAVAGAAVLGTPDPEWGETVAAVVQLREGASVDGAELERFCRQHLASFKTPRTWRFVDGFPQTASGKIQKFALRDLVAGPG
ncbi:AMP-binding protein [Pseudonocardia sp. KRD-184]|uniref:AMP-binding protein n=1 Tax=Pseudonocardia oceani TaxID=2792013 RepID=A0ABS6U2D8_9PSEU|nr:AMP-binding protein [Pseudonocardia oceani]MBW0089182.1 AMP-binding protein [Pseudonocardia oceani]MBW0096128.1 AMP-binding protein [Pseudonocardia oceani]MBW0108892.1 AMP-binding protein [Pseudonocardia oceani]MBW0123036.1 AMP-binding protein [Pseudonocardia oceani]MBW0126161.1 AMP-binding protein [Pseudonocardia oceani]